MAYEDKLNVITSELKTEQTRHSGVITVPAGIIGVRVTMSREDMLDSKVAFACQLFLSLNDGNSWMPWGGAGTVGGEITNSLQEIETESGYETKLPEPSNTKRKIKATVTNSASAKTGLDIQFVK
jgi:hypothetical protein